MSARKIPRKTMRDILWSAHGGEVVQDTITDKSRWSIHHRLVFKLEEDGLLYETDYSVGATESQDEQAWEYDDEVECHRVEAVEVMRVEYKRVAELEAGH